MLLPQQAVDWFTDNVAYPYSNTDPRILRQCTSKSHRQQFITGTSIFLSAIVSGAVFTNFIATIVPYLALRLLFVPVVFGLWFWMIVNMERGIFMGKGYLMVYVRMLLVLVIALITSVMFELHFVRPLLQDRMAEEMAQKDIEAYAPVAKLIGEYEARLNRMDREMDDVRMEKAKMERLRDAESDGLTVDGASGKAGDGILWDEYNNQVNLLAGQLEDMRARRIAEEEKYLRAKKEALERYERRVAHIHRDAPIYEYMYLLKLLQDPDPIVREAVTNFQLGLMLIFMIVELFPAIWKLLMGENHYLALVNAIESAAVELVQRRAEFMRAKVRLLAPRPEDLYDGYLHPLPGMKIKQDEQVVLEFSERLEIVKRIDESIQLIDEQYVELLDGQFTTLRLTNLENDGEDGTEEGGER